MKTSRICLIEDDEIMGGALALRFELEGYACDWFKTGRHALTALQARTYDVVISDIRLPDTTGEVLFASLQAQGGHLPPFLFITGFGTVDQAVRLIKLGAMDYLLKPFEPDALLTKLRSLTAFGAPDSDAGLLGISASMRALETTLPRIARSSTSVLIVGESGVGKERVARKLHALSERADGPFVAVNCGALTETLLEAELFGHEKGAFTGAARARKGLFEQAAGGTLLLDEVGDTPPAMQVKLLRAIQERQITRVGGESPIPVDLRLIAATHQDLKSLVERGEFREDLYYRINVIQLRIPPLRERLEDIPWLASRFLTECGNKIGERKLLSPAAEQALKDYPWPGNVRELRHVLEGACVLATGPVLAPLDLFTPQCAPAAAPPEQTLGDYLAQCERAYLLRSLESQFWRIQETANLLGISRKNLWEKMKKLGISNRDHGNGVDA